ncbi:uncharacterized protein BKA55DRAFT_555152 [Fusarium redolens]|uniref:Uncharacterized protein n=1 Tax=Fusarium redolens TaxID=48865 RepID=A0A9P9KRR7_FUSRE|nr:uncharacterized protein BKA55DRAFT_555152 [Fusarium redolens]KAH7267297.1 hypothetical protein BKA55DRAFT_555152 [Fusarium redolens]
MPSMRKINRTLRALGYKNQEELFQEAKRDFERELAEYNQSLVSERTHKPTEPLKDRPTECFGKPKQEIQDHPHDRKAIHEDHAKITISGEEASIKAEKDKSMNIGKKSTERKDSKDKEI